MIQEAKINDQRRTQGREILVRHRVRVRWWSWWFTPRCSCSMIIAMNISISRSLW